MARNALNHTILESKNLKIFTVTAVLFISFIFFINPVFAANPGVQPSQYSKAMIPASNLVYPLYLQGGSELSITNTGDQEVVVKLLYVNGESCNVSNYYITLTPHEVQVLEIPNEIGFLSAYAVGAIGSDTPINYNYLVGSARIYSEIFGEYNAFGFRALKTQGLTLKYDDINFEKAPRTIAAPVLTSSNDYNTEMLVLISLDTTSLGTVFGLRYDDNEASTSFSLSGNCQLLEEITPSSPQVPSGRTGWMKLYKINDDKPMLGLILHYNTVYVSKGRFQYGIYPLWALTYTNGAYTPIFGGPP